MLEGYNMHLSNLSDGSTLQCMLYIPLILPFFSASGEAPEERKLKEEGKRPTPPPRDSDDEADAADHRLHVMNEEDGFKRRPP